jgi:Nucleotide-diphospho-sugar transferase
MELDVPAERLIDGGIAFFTFTTRGFAPFVLNLHASIKRFDPGLADRLIVFCADDDTVTRLTAADVFALAVEPVGLPESVDFDRPGFGRVVSCKWALARSLLRQAEHVWWCDSDIVVRGPLSERVPALVAGSDADLLMQYEWPKDVLNTGFWIARRSMAVDEMLADMAEQTARADVEDQTYFNERHARAGRLSIAALDPDEFMCGNRFFYRGIRTRPAGLVLHFNYSVGGDVKRELMMEHGAWHLAQSRSAALRARLRYVMVTLGLRVGIWLADGDLVLDVAGDVTGPRRRLLQTTRRIRRRLRRIRRRLRSIRRRLDRRLAR